MNTLAESKPQKKTAQITESLRELVERAGPDTKLPTYLELLSILSVSRTTLNAALDELESQRVIYRRHGIGIFTAPLQRCQTVALVCNPLYFQGRNHSPFWDILLAAARERAVLDDCSCEVHFCKLQGVDVVPFSDNLIHSLRSGHVHGVVGVGMNRAAKDWLQENRIHYISFGGPGAYYVGVDRASIVQQGVRALAKQNCQRVAMLSPVATFKQHYGPADTDWETKVDIFRMALEHHGLVFDPIRLALNQDLIAEPPYLTTLSLQEQGHRSVHQLFANTTSGQPDGLLFTDDVMASGGFAALRELGLQPGQDVQIATHANRGMAILDPYTEAITRLEIDPNAIVDTLFSGIHDLLAGQIPMGFQVNPITQEFQHVVKPVLRRLGESSG